MKSLRSLPRATRRLRRDISGLALIEFALSLPILLLLSLTGAEMTNYIISRMRISQISLHLADNAARIGSGSQLASKKITETDINDLLTGAGLQAGELNLFTNGRVIISSIIPKEHGTPSAHFEIDWQRCRGSKVHPSTYGAEGDLVTRGMGRADREAFAPANGSTMFVEVYYEYQPLIKTSLAPTNNFIEIASMMVRDTRDMTQIYNSEGATISTC